MTQQEREITTFDIRWDLLRIAEAGRPLATDPVLRWMVRAELREAVRALAAALAKDE